MKIPVNETTLLRRIERHLAPDKKLRKAYRRARCVVDLKRNRVVRTDIDLEAFGRELGVLQPYEEFEG